MEAAFPGLTAAGIRPYTQPDAEDCKAVCKHQALAPYGPQTHHCAPVG